MGGGRFEVLGGGGSELVPMNILFVISIWS